ncbi:MAG: glycosyltransferase family 4 protein [Acidimicrobiia bacterium]|nr:glycosyltransferase family 4 protein [Acidimicrobiia bacterium]
MRDWTIAVCPSVDPEAVSLGVLEAMSIGVPVVGTNHGGIPEFLGAAGLLVEPGDRVQLARCIAELIEDDELRGRCSAAGRAIVAASLTLEHQQRSLLDALTDLTASARHARRQMVVFAVPDYEPTLGGTTRQTANQARAMARRGRDVTVLTQRLERSWTRTESSGRLEVRRLRPSGRGGAAMKGFVLSTALWLRRHRRDVEVVHVLMYPDLAVASVLAGLGDRTVMSWAGHGDATDSVTPSSGLLHRTLGRARRRALAPIVHVALTPAIADELTGIGLGRNVTVIPTPVDTSAFRPPTDDERAAARSALHLAADHVAVVYTGHLRALKRVDALVAAFARLAADHGSARLFLVGGGRYDLDDRTDALRRQVRNLGIDDSVTFTGEVASVIPYLYAADIFVMPSDREGLPNSILEAMACGLPVVAPPSAAGDQVLDATIGIVPESNEPALLYEALAALADDPALRRSLGDAAREATIAYELPRVVGMLEQLYATLGATAPTAPDGTRPLGHRASQLLGDHVARGLARPVASDQAHVLPDVAAVRTQISVRVPEEVRGERVRQPRIDESPRIGRLSLVADRPAAGSRPPPDLGRPDLLVRVAVSAHDPVDCGQPVEGVPVRGVLRRIRKGVGGECRRRRSAGAARGGTSSRRTFVERCSCARRSPQVRAHL